MSGTGDHPVTEPWRDAAYAKRYGDETDVYTWRYAADRVLTAAEPLIRADEREKIARLADRYARAPLAAQNPIASQALAEFAAIIRQEQ